MEEFCDNDLPLELQERKPVEPSPESCCGEGCKPCVFDIFEQELKIWRKECAQHLTQNCKSQEVDEQGKTMSPDKYNKYILSNVIELTENSNIYRFLLPRNCALGTKVGQHLILRGQLCGAPLCRQYTPITSADVKGYFDILIKIYATGKMSQYVSTWHIGDEIEWRGPFGDFEYLPNTFQKIIMIAGGTGITPMVGIIHSIIENEKDETVVRLLFACSTYNEILLKSTLDPWKSYWNFSVKYFLSQEKDECKKKYGDEIHYGYITKTLLSAELSHLKNFRIFLCGSNDFNKTMVQHISELGITKEHCFLF